MISYAEKREKIRSQMKKILQSQPEVMKTFSSLHHAATQEGALSPKVKELIALAISVYAHCDGCIAFHTHDAIKAGASKEDIMETLGVAILMGGGPATMYATHAVEAMEEEIR